MRTSAVRILSTLVVVALGASACQRASSDAPATRDPTAPEGADVRREPADPTHWEQEGFVRMVAPIRSPTSRDGRTRIQVLVRLPQGGVVSASSRDGRPFVVLPSFARAVRVEYLAAAGRDVDAPLGPGDRVLDVRGTTLAGAAQRFHVLRPAGSSLLGMEWPNDDAVQARVDDGLMGWAEAGVFGTRGDRRLGEHLRRLDGCASCHVPERSSVPTALVKRPTDTHGFFQIASVFWDDGPFETYRPRDANAGDPFVERRCGEAQVEASVTSCADGTPPTGRLRLAEALAAHDPHAAGVCASRQALARAFDASARHLLEGGLAACAAR